MVLRGGDYRNVPGGGERQIFVHGARVSVQRISGEPEVGLKDQPSAGDIELCRSSVSLPVNFSHLILSF